MNDERPRRKVRVDLQELRFALEDASYEHRYFLDTETGELILVSETLERSIVVHKEKGYARGQHAIAGEPSQRNSAVISEHEKCGGGAGLFQKPDMFGDD